VNKLLAALSLGTLVEGIAPTPKPKEYVATNPARNNFPHQGKREIARRLRQKARGGKA
jgi:hypothetical protein